MKVSEETVRFRSRADEKRRFVAAAEDQGITLSAWVRRSLRASVDGQTIAHQNQVDARLRMALNRLASLANDPTADAIAAEAKALLGRPRT